MMIPHHAERQEVARFMRRLYRRHLTTTSGGNISCRTTDGHILLTASKFDKARLTATQVGVLALDGSNLTPDLRPSIEAEMHLTVYRRHPEIQAIVNAHPVTASVFCACERPLNTRLLGEAYAIVGPPVKAPYATMGTPELAENVALAVGQGTCILLANHGILTVGRSLLEAFDRLEVTEIAAQTNVLLAGLGGPVEIPADKLADLDRLMGRL